MAITAGAIGVVLSSQLTPSSLDLIGGSVVAHIEHSIGIATEGRS